MKRTSAQSPTLKVVEAKAKPTGARQRRLSGVMPELRDRIQPLFHRGVAVERIAEDLDVSPLQLLEHVVRVYCGAKQPGPILVTARVGAQSATLAMTSARRVA